MADSHLREIYGELIQSTVQTGKATRNGTSRYFSRFLSHENFINPIYFCSEAADTGWIVSKAGLGTYRFSQSGTEHKAALMEALLSGINVIDTAPGFSDGGAEYLTGRVIRELINLGKIRRSEVVVITKGGMIEGRHLRYLKETSASGFHTVHSGLGYTLEPELLEQQLRLSLSRLGLETTDVYLISNPEYMLSISGEEQFYKKMHEAFLFLETMREAGLIQYYGIALNPAFNGPHPDPGRLLKDSPPGLQVLEAPSNFAETDFLNLVPEKPDIWKIGQRPFNALIPCRPVRLLRMAAMEPYMISSELDRRITEKKENLKILEQRIVSAHAHHEFRFELGFPSLLSLTDPFYSSDTNPESCVYITESIREKLGSVISRIQLLGILNAEDSLMKHWLKTMNQLLTLLELRVRSKSYETVIDLETDLNRISGLPHRISLGGLTLLWLTGRQGIGTVLCGARNIIYVRDILKSLLTEPLPPEKLSAISEKVQEFLLQYQADFCTKKI